MLLLHHPKTRLDPPTGASRVGDPGGPGRHCSIAFAHGEHSQVKQNGVENQAQPSLPKIQSCIKTRRGLFQQSFGCSFDN